MNHRTNVSGCQLVVAARFRTAIGWVAVVGFLAAAATHGYFAQQSRSVYRRDRLASVAEVVATRLQVVNSDNDSANDEWVTALERETPDITNTVRALAAAIVRLDGIDSVVLTDAQGQIVFQWPNSNAARAPIEVPTHAMQTAWVSSKLAGGIALEGAMAPLQAQATGVNQGFVGVFSATESAAGLRGASLLTFICVVGGALAIGVLVALRYLNQRVTIPLAQILARGATSNATLPIDRSDEFGTIARQLDQLNGDLDRARKDATRLERSIQTTVHRETKHISNQLRRAERAAEVDALTGLANRRFIEQRLEAVYSEQVARGVNLAIVMFDVDNFKSLNDLAGHAAGDALLRFIGELLAGTLREQDVGVRFGGDEFALILIDVPGTQARNIAERTIKLFARQAAASDLPTTVTLSAGIASLDEISARSGAELMARADDALYESKNKGKNLAIAATDAADAQST